MHASSVFNATCSLKLLVTVWSPRDALTRQRFGRSSTCRWVASVPCSDESSDDSMWLQRSISRVWRGRRHWSFICRFAEGKGTGAVFNALFQACVNALRDVDLPVRSLFTSPSP